MYLSPRTRAKYRRIALVLLFFLVVYISWPTSRIEKFTAKLDGTETQRKKLRGRGSSGRGDEFYAPADKPLRGVYNPDNHRIEIPQVINPSKINHALKRLGLRPLEGSPTTTYPKAVPTSARFAKRSFEAYDNRKVVAALDPAAVAKGGAQDPLTCADAQYKPSKANQIESTGPLDIEDKLLLKDLKEYLATSGYDRQVQELKPLKTLDPKDWFQFSGSAVWLDDEGCYLMASRVVYRPKGKDVVSFLRMRAFDESWKEISKRILYNEVSPRDVDVVLQQYSFTKKESELDGISLKVPSFLNIDFETNWRGIPMGPEDPRMIFREETHEPMIIFNMQTTHRRSIYAAFPLRQPRSKGSILPFTRTLQFIHSGSSALTIQAVEKNWTPFFEENSKNVISFLYTIDPLVVFKCKLDTGKCDKIEDQSPNRNVKQGSAKQGAAKRVVGTSLRGGSNLYRLPSKIVQQLPELQRMQGHDVQLWVGFAKVHSVSPCNGIFRPALYVLAKVDGEYRVDLVSAPLDFGMKIIKYDGSGRGGCSMGGPSVLIVNSIAFWGVSSPSMKKKKIQQKAANAASGDIAPVITPNPPFEDYMVVTLSEGDRTVEMSLMRNVVRYILGIYEEEKVNDNKVLQNFPGDNKAIQQIEQCALAAAEKYSKAYR